MPKRLFFIKILDRLTGASRILGVLVLCLAAGVFVQAQFGAQEQHFAQFAIGGGATTFVTIHNPTEGDITVRVDLYLSDGTLYSEDELELGAGATETLEMGDEEEAINGWAKLSSDDQFTATEFFMTPIGNVGVPPGTLAEMVKVFAFLEDGTRTGLALANPNVGVATLTYSEFDTAGDLQQEVSSELPGHGHTAFFLDEPPLSMADNGVVQIESARPIVAVTLRQDGDLLTATAVIVPGLPIRAEFNDTSPNIIAGHSVNGVAQDVVGATIGGGGADVRELSDVTGAEAGLCRPPCANLVSDNFGTVGGGVQNTSGLFSTVSGGFGNEAIGRFSTVAGGSQNTAFGGASTVGGGGLNFAGAGDATVAGGSGNQAIGLMATVGGGEFNIASETNSTVGGGQFNTASGLGATVPGGSGNEAGGDYSFAVGRQARANSPGSITFADSTDAGFGTLTPGERRDSFNVRASGGTYLYSSADLSSGVQLAPGSSSWSMVSDRANKENLAPVESGQVLERLAAIPVSTWNYKSQETRIRHMGPMAQDFYAAFGLGEDKRRISSVDAAGVALAAIQGLYQILQEKEAGIESLKAEVAEVKKLMVEKSGK